MENEIEFADYIRVLSKWKLFILWITLASIACAAVVSYFVLPKVYGGSAVVTIPDVPSINQNTNFTLCTPEVVAAEINSAGFLTALIKKSDASSNMGIQITAYAIPNSQTIHITINSNSKDAVKKVFANLIPLLQSSECGKVYESQLSFLKEKVSKLQAESDTYKSMLSNIEKKIRELDRVENSNKLMSYSMLLNAYATMSSAESNLENLLGTFETYLSGAHGFKYVADPYVSNDPIKPKKLFNVTVAGVAGLIFATILAFLMELMKSRNETKEVDVEDGD